MSDRLRKIVDAIDRLTKGIEGNLERAERERRELTDELREIDRRLTKLERGRLAATPIPEAWARLATHREHEVVQ